MDNVVTKTDKLKVEYLVKLGLEIGDISEARIFTSRGGTEDKEKVWVSIDFAFRINEKELENYKNM